MHTLGVKWFLPALIHGLFGCHAASRSSSVPCVWFPKKPIPSSCLAFVSWPFGGGWGGFLAALVLATGLEFCVMSRLMLTDIPLAAFLAAALFCFWLALKEESHRDKWMFWHLVWAGLAVLTKGPLGSLVTVVATVAFSLSMRWPVLYRGRGFWWGVVAYAVIVGPWYALMFAWHAKPFWEEFFIRDNWLRVIRAEHPSNNHFWYYPGLLLLGSLPWMPTVALTARRAWGAQKPAYVGARQFHGGSGAARRDADFCAPGSRGGDLCETRGIENDAGTPGR